MKIRETIDQMLKTYSKLFNEQLGDNMIGMYLYNSLSLNAYEEDNSDINLLIVLNEEPDKSSQLKIRSIHGKICARYKIARRLTCLIITKKHLGRTDLDIKDGYCLITKNKFYHHTKYDLQFYVWLTASKESAIISGPPLSQLGIIMTRQHTLENMKKFFIYHKKYFKKCLRHSESHKWFQHYIFICCQVLYTVDYNNVIDKRKACQYVASHFPYYRNIIDKALLLRDHQARTITLHDLHRIRSLYFYAFGLIKKELYY